MEAKQFFKSDLFNENIECEGLHSESKAIFSEEDNKYFEEIDFQVATFGVPISLYSKTLELHTPEEIEKLRSEYREKKVIEEKDELASLLSQKETFLGEHDTESSQYSTDDLGIPESLLGGFGTPESLLGVYSKEETKPEFGQFTKRLNEELRHSGIKIEK